MSERDDAAPLVIGLTGLAGTGKTATAHALAPAGQQFSLDAPPARVWDHLFFALPLYRMATARHQIRGPASFDRLRYELHDALAELFPRTLPYYEFVEMVLEVAELPIEAPGTKPRSFLQHVGTEICRAHDPQCFVRWMGHTIARRHREHRAAWDEPAPPFAVVVSDVRFANEAAFVRAQPRAVLIKFTAAAEVRQARVAARDGLALSAAQAAHASEAEIPDADVDVVVDTTTRSLAEQITTVRSLLEEYTC